ncbi:hypothetical protein [Desulfosporosinus fructosivorans]
MESRWVACVERRSEAMFDPHCAKDGAFGTIVSSGDYRRRRVL